MGDAAKKKAARRPFGAAAFARPGAKQNTDAISGGKFPIPEFAVSGPESSAPAPEPPAKDEPKKPKSDPRKKKPGTSAADEQGPEDAPAGALVPLPAPAAEAPPPENAARHPPAAGSFRDFAARKEPRKPAFWSDREIWGEKPSRTCGLDSRDMLRAILTERDWLDTAMRRTPDPAERAAMAEAANAAREKFLDAAFGSNQAAKDGVRALADRIDASPRIPSPLILFPDMEAPMGVGPKQWDAARATLESLHSETGRLFARCGMADGHRALAEAVAEGGDFESYLRKVGIWPVAAPEADQFGEPGTLEAFFGEDDA